MSSSRATEESPRQLAAAGLALIVLLLGRAVVPGGGESAEWASYLLLGTLYPTLLLGLAIATWAGGAAGRAAAALELGLGLIALAASGLFMATLPRWAALLTGVLHLAVVRIADRRPDSPSRPSVRHLGLLLCDLILTATVWNAAAGLGFFPSFGEATLQTLVRTPYILALPICLMLVIAGLRARPIPAPRARSWGRSVANAIAIGLLGFISFRADYLFNHTADYHWGFFIGPAELVRHGGWLLWDVPAQYGFLSTLTVALAPTTSVWDGFFRISAVLLLFSASLLFFHLRSLGRGPANLLCAFLVTVSAVFVLPGFAGLDGWPAPLVTPSGGPIRFVWCLVLLSLLRLAAQRRRQGRSPGVVMVAGCAAWLLGSLWSFESAVYCSAIWLPAYGLMVWQARDPTSSQAAPGWHARRLALRLSAPALLAATAVGVITAYYVARLGHPPDWYGFAEYGLLFGTGYGAEPINPRGSVWLLFVLFCGLSTALATALRHRSLDDLVPLVGAWAGLWAVSSYFVGRSVELAVTNLTPVSCTVIALLLHTIRGRADPTPWDGRLEMACVAILAVILTLALGSSRWVEPGAWDVRGRDAWSIEPRRPVMPPGEQTLLARVGVRDPIAFCTDTLPGHWDGLPKRAWLPIAPLPMFAELPQERRKLYVSRFVARAGLSGWLVEPKAASPYFTSGCRWLRELVQPTHETRRSYENDALRLTWFNVRSHPGGS